MVLDGGAWAPEAGWVRLGGGGSPSTVGVWSGVRDGRDVVVKRLARPGPHDPGELSDPAHPAWWRREVEVALSGRLVGAEGLRALPVLAVEEDDEGATLVLPPVVDAALPGLFVAAAMARFAGSGAPPAWGATDQLRRRLALVERRGGWRTLARTTAADVADHLWSRREGLLARLDDLPQVPQHGDPVPANLRGRDGEHVVAVDWSTWGTGPVGADLGYWSLSAREELEPLLDAYCAALPPAVAGAASRDDVALAARVVAVMTVLTRADRALGSVAAGEGALAAKFRHPAVAPHLRALQRQAPQVRALLDA